tara:strand:- start:245 stop:1459 length:1215 start_codon:yes stop_codon:yes gene_type:complete
MKVLLPERVKKIIKFMLVVFFGLPCATLMRLIYPIFLIRIGYIPGERIGHFADDSYHFFLEKELSTQIFSMNLFYIKGAPCNQFFARFAKRHINIYKFVELIYLANDWLPYKTIFYKPNNYQISGSRDLEGMREMTDKTFQFSPEENLIGNEFLNKIGCQNIKKFVCVNIRDSKYLKEKFSDYDFSYHTYRDSDCQSYELAVKELISRGYFVIRMGKVVNKKMNIDSDQFLDYPFCNFSSDFLDIWLMANCTFCISTSSGLDSIPNIFRRPVAYVNAMPIGDFTSFNRKTIWMAKTILNKNNQALSINELIAKDLIHFYHHDRLAKFNLHVEDNTPEEIYEVAKEIEEKVSGSWDPSKDNIDKRNWIIDLLQTSWKDFESLHNPKIFNQKSYGFFSNTFLNKIF